MEMQEMQLRFCGQGSPEDMPELRTQHRVRNNRRFAAVRPFL
jgi:hypothetical protein